MTVAWISVLKLLGLAVTAGLGVAGTVWETKTKDESGEAELTPQGKRIVAGIILASTIAGLSQIVEDRQKRKDDADAVAQRRHQIQALSDITTRQERLALPFSGHLLVGGLVIIPSDQPSLQPLLHKLRSRPPVRRTGIFNVDDFHTVEDAILPLLQGLRMRILIRERGAGEHDRLQFEVKTLPLQRNSSPSPGMMYRPQRSPDTAFTHLYDVYPTISVEFAQRASNLDANDIDSLLDFADKRVLVMISGLWSRQQELLAVRPDMLVLTDIDSGRSLVLTDWKASQVTVEGDIQDVFESDTAKDVSGRNELFGWH
jgi:hypothetical protein